VLYVESTHSTQFMPKMARASALFITLLSSVQGWYVQRQLVHNSAIMVRSSSDGSLDPVSFADLRTKDAKLIIQAFKANRLKAENEALASTSAQTGRDLQAGGCSQKYLPLRATVIDVCIL